ncbi:hypothetical protein CTI14_47385 [Methylobacterium radiotolerans]|nr:hypothetical protein CTI14_47385 [Methylobacterium radiotolerans]
MTAPAPLLFTPLTLRNLTLPNRIVLSPMYTKLTICVLHRHGDVRRATRLAQERVRPAFGEAASVGGVVPFRPASPVSLKGNPGHPTIAGGRAG